MRFRVPSDLRSHIDSRFVVRGLYTVDKDHIRLARARMGAALSEAFAAIRGGTVAKIDIKDVLDRARRGETRDLALRDVVLWDGTRLGTVESISDADFALSGAVQIRVVSPFPRPAPSLPALQSASFSDAFDKYRERCILAKQGGDVDLQVTQRIFEEINLNDRHEI